MLEERTEGMNEMVVQKSRRVNGLVKRSTTGAEYWGLT